MLYLWLIGIGIVVILALYFTASSRGNSRYDHKVFDPIEERLRQNDFKNESEPPTKK